MDLRSKVVGPGGRATLKAKKKKHAAPLRATISKHTHMLQTLPGPYGPCITYIPEVTLIVQFKYTPCRSILQKLYGP